MNLPTPTLVTTATAASATTAFFLAGVPGWISVAPALAGAAVVLVTHVHQEVRATRRVTHQQRQERAHARQQRALEHQAVAAAQALTDPDLRVDALLRLVELHNTAPPGALEPAPAEPGQSVPGG
ncbi:hypothetical protein ACQEVG_16150 [Streptomyces sp. CA-135486]|uniref:hypothetical protein n=1 Tax=Streptomyces sp. CA-135486 TaxID=3240049 RepID=UPI003D8DE814